MAIALRLQRRLWVALAAMMVMLPGVAVASAETRCEAMPAGCTACSCCEDSGPATGSGAASIVAPVASDRAMVARTAPCSCRSDEPSAPARRPERGDEGRRVEAGRSLAADEPPILGPSRPLAAIAVWPDVGPPRSPIYLRTSRLLI